ncbi:HD-GYP domain-containing protein [Shewanella litoralis]|uniref:Phosphohydrolase n=1 Tax=Shewanella litoralis TaxID=2282700 RepID=A0ABQ2RAC8_9GAMM|nr:HD domain-containing phosphohydrolase [Shewanella litoralis]GGQ20813.1 phosphohydrolase [Shewanella litoralis]
MAKAELTQIPVSQMVIGLTVKLPLSWTSHPFFRSKVKLEQQVQIEMIKGLDVDFVYVIDGHDLLPVIEAPIEIEQPQEELVQEVDYRPLAKKSMRLSQQRFVKSVNDSRTVFGKVVSDPEGTYREAATLVEDLVGHLYESETPHLTLVGSGDADKSVTQHGISVAVLAMMIAHTLQLSKTEVRDIALGSLFHDIGKLKVPEDIRRKRGELTDVEANFLKKHPNFGFDMLKRSGLFPDAMLDIVLHHHEFIDGSGFPDGLNEAKLLITTQVVSLANDYETLLSKYHTPQIALGILFKNHSSKHSDKLISVLVKILGIYPPGTIVRLTDDSIAKVMMTTADVKQPHVWSCDTSGGEPSFRFLISEDVQVKEVIKLDELSEGAVKTLQANNSISFYFNHFNH